MFNVVAFFKYLLINFDKLTESANLRCKITLYKKEGFVINGHLHHKSLDYFFLSFEVPLRVSCP